MMSFAGLEWQRHIAEPKVLKSGLRWTYLELTVGHKNSDTVRNELGSTINQVIW